MKEPPISRQHDISPQMIENHIYSKQQTMAVHGTSSQKVFRTMHIHA